MKSKVTARSPASGNATVGFAPSVALKLRSCGRFPMLPEFHVRKYKHPTIAIHQHEYPCSLLIGGRKFAVKPGDVTVTPSRTVSRYEPGRAGFHWCIHFDEPKEAARFSLPMHIHTGAAAPYIAERMEQIVHLQRMADLNRKASGLFTTAASASLSALLLWLAVFARERKTPDKGRLGPAMVKLQALIEQRFREPLTAAELAREIGFSQDYLAQQFRIRHGMTLQRYLLSRRIEMARNLLLSTDMPVKAVGWECGIPDQQYFNKQFRRICGVSPSQFRQTA